MTFRSYDDALIWSRIHGHENCRPCDRLEIIEVGKHAYMIAIRMKWSGKFVGYAT